MIALQEIFALSIFIICFALFTNNKLNAVLIALSGGFLMILLHIVSQEKAFSHYIDWNVIFLLIGMMLMIGVIKTTGLFEYVAIKTAKIAKGEPVKILIMLFFTTAIFSAFLDNVTTVIILTPISILIAVELGISPLPFVITQAIASNIGGTATLIGDPPNLMIGSAANLNFMDFVVNLSPVIAILIILNAIIFFIFFKHKLIVHNSRKARILEFDEKQQIMDKGLLIFSIITLIVFVILLFFQDHLKIHAATIAIICALVLMIKNHKNIKFEEFFGHEIEWESIFFFIGLFVLVGGVEEVGFIDKVSNYLINLTQGNIRNTSVLFIWGFGIASSIINNIPFVATMIPLLQKMGQALGQQNVMPLWWALSLGTCLGGNGTLIGASANIISTGIAKKSGFPISFWQFTKYGMLVTFVNLSVSSIYVYFRYF
jgi:Na+/H+ antiporter NhaD/arsenite permease-like protein